MPAIGEVVRALTTNLIGKRQGWKYHFCICSVNRLYLYVCEDEFLQDFPITHQECDGLPNQVSFISFSRKIHLPDDQLRRMQPSVSCTASDEFMIRFGAHVQTTPVLSERDRAVILGGIGPRIQTGQNPC